MDMNAEVFMKTYNGANDVILEFYKLEDKEVQSPVYLLNQEQMDTIKSALIGMAAMIRAHEWNVEDSLPIDKVASEVAIELYKPRLLEARDIIKAKDIIKVVTESTIYGEYL